MEHVWCASSFLPSKYVFVLPLQISLSIWAGFCVVYFFFAVIHVVDSFTWNVPSNRNMLSDRQRPKALIKYLLPTTTPTSVSGWVSANTHVYGFVWQRESCVPNAIYVLVFVFVFVLLSVSFFLNSFFALSLRFTHLEWWCDGIVICRTISMWTLHFKCIYTCYICHTCVCMCVERDI